MNNKDNKRAIVDHTKSFTHERQVPSADTAPTSRPEAMQDNTNVNPTANSQQTNTNSNPKDK